MVKTKKPYDKFYPILSAIKRCFSRSPLHRDVLTKAKHLTEKGPKGGARYTCADCGDHFAQGKVQVDHISPVIPVDVTARDMSWDEIVDRIFCPPGNYQTICVDCHKVKSKEENKLRRSLKKDKKNA